jgi:integrase
MDRYRIFRRSKTWYLENAATGEQKSLRTRDKREALRVLSALHEAQENPSINLQIARAYLNVADEAYTTRKWADVFRHVIEDYKVGSECSRRWLIEEKSKSYDIIRHKVVAETTPEDFKAVLKAGTVSTNVYLRRLQNYALGMNWLIMPVLPKKLFPKPEYKDKRAITYFEHERILAREENPERHAYYELIWHTGGSQGDIAKLHAEDIDKANRVISFERQKVSWRKQAPPSLKYGPAAERLFSELPEAGPLFPNLSQVLSKDRATEFKQRCEGLGIEGVTLHSYRYAWAERAKSCGYPERFAMVALGHSSKAVHRAYAKGAAVEIPSLESYESRATGSQQKAAYPANGLRQHRGQRFPRHQSVLGGWRRSPHTH